MQTEPQDLDVIIRRTREVVIDVVMAHELATGSPAGRLLWERVGQSPPEDPPTVQRHTVRGVDGRETDVFARVADGRILLVEDKAVGGHFQRGQVESYELECLHDIKGKTWTCLVAPQSFIDANAGDARKFSAAVSLEDLADVLVAAASSDLSMSTELAAGYRHQAELLRECAATPSASENWNELVQAFGDSYRQLARELAGDWVVPGRFRSTSNRIVTFKTWNELARPAHKLELGLVDVYILKGWTMAGLTARLSTLDSEEQPPAGWFVSMAGRTPALRHELPPIADIGEFEDARPILIAAVECLAELRAWFDTIGSRVLALSPEAAIGNLIETAARLAEETGRSELAGSLLELNLREGPQL